MKNFNDVINSVGEASNIEEMLNKTKAYAKKSAEAIEISRKRIELLDAKTKLAKAFEKYGRLQFKVYEGEEVSEDDISACTEEIVMLKSQSEFLEAEIEAFKEAISAELEAKMNSTKKEEDVVVEDVEIVDSDK